MRKTLFTEAERLGLREAKARSAKARSVRGFLRGRFRGTFTVKEFVGDNGEPMSLVKPKAKSDHAWVRDDAQADIERCRKVLGEHYDTDLDRTPDGLPVLWVVQKGSLYAAAPWKIPASRL